MRIAVVHSFYSSSSPSGENSVVRAQVSALRKAGHTVELIDRYTDKEERTRFYKPRALLTAANIGGASPDSRLTQFNPDVVHVHNLFPNWGTQWLEKWGPKVVSTLHNFRTVCASAVLWRDGHDCSDCLEKGSLSSIRNSCYRDSRVATLPLAWATRASGSRSPILTHSAALITLNSRAFSLYQGLLPGKQMFECPNFAVDTFETAPEPATQWVYVGRLTEEKGVRWLLQNWPSKHPLTIIGTGDLEALVSHRASEPGSNITFLGKIRPEQVQAHLRKSHAILIPSLWSEGIPTVALEALQACTPIIISEKCASAEQLTSNNSGITIDPETPASLNQAMDDVMDRNHILRPSARAKYEKLFSEQAWIARITPIYRAVIDRSQ